MMDIRTTGFKINRNIKDNQNMVVLLSFLAILLVLFSVFSSSFFKFGNLMQISAQMVELALLTIGMSVCVISGGFDLSIGSLAGLGSVCLAMMITAGINMWLALPLVALALMLCGAFNGLLIGYLNLNPLLVTLATSSLYAGIALGVSSGKAISGLPDYFFVFGQGYVGFIPVQVIILVVILVVSIILINYTPWGRRVYLIGSNPQVARFSGIDLGWNTLLVYIFSAFLAFLASVVLTSRLATGRADLGSVYVLPAVSAAVFGGVKVSGGSGSVLGAIIGVTTFAVISNGFNMLDFSQYAQQIVVGVILIAAYAMWERKR
jgi:ribose/xylose/arabinose/galactoside ABC-type transport system permease subunit